jgi:hypothetical protein
MTAPKRWPYNARMHRDEAADRIMDIIRELQPLVHNGRALSETERLRRQARALSAAQDAAHWLSKAGAPIQPIEGSGSPRDH